MTAAESPSAVRSGPHWGWVAAFALISAGLLATALEGALHFNGPPLDGPFQLFNALRRIADGQRIGETFQFFHGPAVPYLFYPSFVLGGATFFASEASRQLVSVVLFLATTLIAFRAWTGSWRAGLPLATAAVLVMIEFRLNALILPINSLLGVRATMPILVGAHLIMRQPGRRADIERGVLLGFALLLGTEQGAASIAALALVNGILAIRSREWRARAMSLGIGTVVAIAIYLLAVVILAGPTHTASVLRFNFVEVPKDQLWYFGAPPNPFLSRWSEILPLLNLTRWWVVLVAAVIIAMPALWRAARGADTRRVTADAFLVVYGLISMASMLGTFVAAYAQPAIRVTLIVVIAWIYRRWPEWRVGLAERLPALAPRAPALAMGAIIGITMVRNTPAVVSMIRAPLHVALAHILDSQGKTMTADWQTTGAIGAAVLDTARARAGRSPTVWSTYAGLVEANAGVFHPGTDYIIHALGPYRRAEYAERFQASRPDVVQTVRPVHTPYEEWLEGTHWNFYEPLLNDYDVVAAGPWSFFWMRRGGPPLPAPALVANTAVPPGQMAISVDTRLAPDSVGLFEVRLRYRTTNALAMLPVIGGMPRYLVEIGGTANRLPVSLAPYTDVRSFPVIASGRSPILLRASVASLFGGASLTIDSIRVERIPLSEANAQWAVDVIRAGTAR